jgi:Uma2 family endonuclease
MAVSARITLDEYLHSSEYERCEFIDGRPVPKSMGSGKHALIQTRLAIEIAKRLAPDEGEPVVELSLLLPNRDVLIPDVVVTKPGQRVAQNVAVPEPPRVCIEVVSPDQSRREIFRKCERYLAWGVSYAWVIDPETRRVWQFQNGSPIETPAAGALDAGSFSLSIAEILKAID